MEYIADKINMSIDAVSKKLTSLRTQYSRLMKKLPSGSGRAAKTAHQKWLVSKLDFLTQHLKKRDSLSNIVSIQVTVTNVKTSGVETSEWLAIRGTGTA